MDNRYRALKTVSTLYRIAGVIIFALGILAIILGIVDSFSRRSPYAAAIGLSNIVTGLLLLVAGIFPYAIGEGIMLAISVSEAVFNIREIERRSLEAQRILVKNSERTVQLLEILSHRRE